MTKDTATSNDNSEETQNSGETSDQTSTENSSQTTDTSEQKTDLVTAYADNPETTRQEDTVEYWKNRHAESSKEAIRLAKLVKEGKKAGQTAEQPGETTDERDARLARMERYIYNQTLKELESGKNVTPEQRKQMWPIIQKLTAGEDGDSLEDAWEIAWLRINKDSMAEKARLEGMASVYGSETAKINVSGKPETLKVGEELPKLTKEEYEQAKRWKAVNPDGTVDKNFLKHLAAIRKQS